VERPCLHASMPPCLHASMPPCLHASTLTGVAAAIFGRERDIKAPSTPERQSARGSSGMSGHQRAQQPLGRVRDSDGLQVHRGPNSGPTGSSSPGSKWIYIVGHGGLHVQPAHDQRTAGQVTSSQKSSARVDPGGSKGSVRKVSGSEKGQMAPEPSHRRPNARRQPRRTTGTNVQRHTLLAWVSHDAVGARVLAVVQHAPAHETASGQQAGEGQQHGSGCRSRNTGGSW
jgi:hypothetical protein